MHIGGKYAILLLASVFAATGPMASAATQNQLLRCTAHFAARAEWLRKTDGEAATIALFERRADHMLRKMHEQAPPSDWGMVIGPRFDPYETHLKSFTLNTMTNFAAQSHSHPPLCAEDQACISCTELYKANQ